MLMISPTGSRRTKADHPALPMTISEIVSTTLSCAAAGAEALHLHVRDERGLHSLDPGRYAETLAELERVLPRFPVQITTESGGIFGTQDQLNLLRVLKPRWASISLRETARDMRDARRIYDHCRDYGIEVQHIIYARSDIELLRHWQAERVLAPKTSVIFVLGDYAEHRTSDPADLDVLRAALPGANTWMACAFGRSEHTCLAAAAAKGGDVRVGFENSLTRPDGTRWSSMADSVSSLKKTIGRDLCHISSRAV